MHISMSEGSETQTEVWSWGREIRATLRIRRPSRAWIKTSALVLAFTLLAVAGCAALGIYSYGDASRYFGEHKFGTYVSTGLLIAAAVVCFKIRAKNPSSPLQRFWLWWGVLLCVTAADDLFRLHEEIDRTFHRLSGRNMNDPITDHIDDVLVAAYAIPAAMLWFRNRRLLIRNELMVQTLALAFVGFVITSAMDFTMNNKGVEESVKLVAEALIVCSMLAAYYELPASSTKSAAERSGRDLPVALDHSPIQRPAPSSR